MSGETGDSVAPPAELDNKSARAPAPIRLHLMVEHNAQETTKKQDRVIKARALVSC